MCRLNIFSIIIIIIIIIISIIIIIIIIIYKQGEIQQKHCRSSEEFLD